MLAKIDFYWYVSSAAWIDNNKLLIVEKWPIKDE